MLEIERDYAAITIWWAADLGYASFLELDREICADIASTALVAEETRKTMNGLRGDG